MKARVKATGEIVEVHTCNDADFVDRKGKYYWENELFFGSLDTFHYDEPDYWTRLEHQYAGMAMQGILSNANHALWDRENNAEGIAKSASAIAHALVEKYKKEERK